MAENKQSHKRKLKQFLIYPKFQLTLIGFNTVVMAIAFLAVGVQTFRSFEKLREMGVTAELAENHAYFKFLSYQAETLYAYLGIALAVAFVVTSLVTLVLSHRLAGPLVRLRRYFEELGQTGEPYPLKFRQGDFFSEIPPAINQGIEKMQENQGKHPSRGSDEGDDSSDERTAA